MHEVNDLALQRLVDGELSLAEGNALLQRLDQQPESWRELALRLVEQRRLEEAAVAWDVPQTNALDRWLALPASPSKGRFALGKGGLALAASLLVVALTGWALGRYAMPSADLTANRANPGEDALEETPPAAHLSDDATSTADESAFEPTAGNGDATQRLSTAPAANLEVAHSPAQSAARHWVVVPVEPRPGLSAEQRWQWLKRGYLVDEVSRLRQIDQPERTITVSQPAYHVRYVGGLAYQ